jgi:hypothetical protein
VKGWMRRGLAYARSLPPKKPAKGKSAPATKRR